MGNQKEMSKRTNDKKAVNGNHRADHKGFEAHVHFMLLEHDLNLPAMGVMSQYFFISKP